MQKIHSFYFRTLSNGMGTRFGDHFIMNERVPKCINFQLGTV